MAVNFTVGDKVVYPGQGVAEVADIEQRTIGESAFAVYVLTIVESGLKIMVPCGKENAVGLRPIISEREVADVYDILRSETSARDTQTWNRRHREYMEKIKTGSCFEIAEVLRDLARLRTRKELSFGERRMMDTAHGLLVRELALAEQISEDEVERAIDSIFRIAA